MRVGSLDGKNSSPIFCNRTAKSVAAWREQARSTVLLRDVRRVAPCTRPSLYDLSDPGVPRAPAVLFPAQGVSIGSTERYVPHAHTIPRGTHRGECVRLRARLHSPVVSFALGLLRFVRNLASSFTSHRKGSHRNMMAGGAPHG